MKTENLVIHHCRQWEVIEDVCEHSPDFRIPILPLTLVVEAIHLSDLPHLVIASQDSYPVRESHFRSDQKRHCLYRKVTSVYVISHEQVVCVRWLASDLEKLLKVMELPMDVSAYSHWRSYLDDVGLVYQDFLSFLAEYSHLIFR